MIIFLRVKSWHVVILPFFLQFFQVHSHQCKWNVTFVSFITTVAGQWKDTFIKFYSNCQTTFGCSMHDEALILFHMTTNITFITFTILNYNLFLNILNISMKLTWADLHFVSVIAWPEAGERNFELSDYPKLHALRKRVEEVPKLAEWITQRPHTKWWNKTVKCIVWRTQIWIVF